MGCRFVKIFRSNSSVDHINEDEEANKTLNEQNNRVSFRKSSEISLRNRRRKDSSNRERWLNFVHNCDFFTRKNEHLKDVLPSTSSPTLNEAVLQEIVRCFPFVDRGSSTRNSAADLSPSKTCGTKNGCDESEYKKIKVVQQFTWPSSTPSKRKRVVKIGGGLLHPSNPFLRRKSSAKAKRTLAHPPQGVLQLMVVKSVETIVPMVIPLEHWLKERLATWVQLSGHKGTIIPASEKTLWKKCVKLSGQNYEAEAYCKLMHDTCMPFLPRLYKEVEYNDELFIEIEDLTRLFESPSIMDIKMGTRTFLESEIDNPKKRPDLFLKMVQLDPTEPTLEENTEKAITKLRYMQFRERESSTATLGFRIDGMKENFLCDLRKDFKKLKEKEEMQEVFRTFFGSSENGSLLIEKIVQRLKDIRQATEKSDFFKAHEVIGSSLLLLHDDDSASVFMIDFAKAIPLPASAAGSDPVKVDHRSLWVPGNKEDGYIFGLDNLISILESM